MVKVKLSRTVFGPWGEGKKDQVVDAPDYIAEHLIADKFGVAYVEPAAAAEHVEPAAAK
jgi:hypothetical protein